MAPPASVLSQTLQSISLTKIREIENQRDKYEVRKNEVLAAAAKHPSDVRKRIDELLRGVADLYPEAMGDHKVKNIRCWLQQSKHDPSMPAEILQSSEEVLRSKLEVQSRKLGLAHLYSRLVTEWMNSTTPMDEAAAVPDDASFEVVDRQKERLQELCDKFEKVVFEPLEVDEEEIDLYLRNLFDGEDGSKALDNIRRSMKHKAESLLGNRTPFDEATLKWCIKGLLVEDLLSDEKQAILRDFLENSMVLREIADVLNVRYTDFESWEWQAGEEGIPVLPRQQLNGKYRIWMDEDVLQAIFTHYVGTNCCVGLKKTLENFIMPKDGLWKWRSGPGMTHKEATRRAYYITGHSLTQYSVDEERRKRYRKSFFLSQLPSSTEFWSSTYDNDGEAEPEDDDAPADKRESINIKEALLHTLATESVMHRSLYGESAVLQSDLQWFATGLSHTTIFAVMRFFGFPEVLTTFFRKVLEAPLNMVPSSGAASRSQGPRIRKRGVPMAHAPEKLIGELILFVMDLAVNQETGMLMYRLHDDLFLCGEPPRVAKAWKAMRAMAKVMGLEFNMHKTGSVYLTEDGRSLDTAVAAGLPKGVVRIGHLTLDPTSGEWTLDQKQVGEHVAQLGKQLAACTSVLDWVKTWNSCVSRFFSHTFGEPAFCFGAQHVDSILKTYQQMQRVLFGGAQNSRSDPTTNAAGGDGDDEDALQANVVRHLKSKIEARFGITGIPDAFIFLPEKLGGLGLRNPFIPFLAVRQDFDRGFSSAQAVLRTCFDAERGDYAAARRVFYAYGSVEERLRQVHSAAAASWTTIADYEASRADTLGALDPAEHDTFFSFEEYTRWRETTSFRLQQAYLKLLEAPTARGPDLDDDVRGVLTQLSISPSDPSPKLQEVPWILQMYGDELRDQCGGLRLVEQKFLPLGLLSMMRRKAVRWNLVL
ncbi:hypothetical protein F5X96DRAFT_633140 [Biscogniauxia mediterranea]|nr:hypothetical protein F5X96DRAFT_633140 [Biscogniauxia mediterranea]